MFIDLCGGVFFWFITGVMTYVFIGTGGDKQAGNIIAARKNKKLQCVFYLDSIVQGEAKYKEAYLSFTWRRLIVQEYIESK